MTETFSVAEMRTHQASLESINSTTGALVTKARETGAGDSLMYGVFATPIVYPILMVGDAIHSHTIGELGAVMNSVSEAFKTTADLYDATEQANVDLAQVILDQVNDMEKRSR